MSNAINYIYTLSDLTGVRYVGKTNNPNTRLKNHIREAKSKRYNNHRVNWVKNLLMSNSAPILEVIDETDGDWVWLEKYWISQFKTWGFNLVNGTDGGENPPSWLGKTHSDEYKKIRQALMQANNPSKGGLSDEWKNNISNAHKLNNVKPPPQTKKQIIQYTLNGLRIKDWPSIKEAANTLGFKSTTGINLACQGKRHKAGGFKWGYKDFS